MKIRIMRIWPYRSKRVITDIHLPREFLSAVYQAIPRRYRDNHIVVEAWVVQGEYTEAKWIIQFSDSMAHLADADSSDGYLARGDYDHPSYEYGKDFQ